jgi:DMSO reductase anchor subunit
MGALGVFCSVMVYVATRRSQWSGTQTGVKFFGTTLSLGAVAVLTVYAFSSASGGTPDRVTHALWWLVLTVTALKLSFEASGLRHIGERRYSVLKRMALLMVGELRGATAVRFGFGVAGGIALPLLMLGEGIQGSSAQLATAAALVLLLVSELAERYLFFRAAPASRMPGGIR